MLVACAFAACGSDEVEPTPTPDPKPELVKMSFLVNAGEETRTVLMHGGENENQVWFQNGDKIKIFDTCSEGHEFSTTLNNAPSASATFNGYAHKSAEADFYALYPYQEKASLNTDNGIIFAILPSQQNAINGSFDPKANLSVSCIDMSDNEQSEIPSFTLKNAGSLVKFTVSESMKNLKSVKLEDNSNPHVPLSGWMAIKVPKENEISVGTISGDGYPADNSVTLSASNGSTLSPGGTYYIVVWPGTHSSLTITLTNSEGKTKTGTLTGTLSDDVTFNRAKIFNLGTF